MNSTDFKGTCIKFDKSASLYEIKRAFQFYQFVHPKEQIFIKHTAFGSSSKQAADHISNIFTFNYNDYVYIGWPDEERIVTSVSAWLSPNCFSDDAIIFDTLDEAMSYRAQAISNTDYTFPIAVSTEGLNEEGAVEVIKKLQTIAKFRIELEVHNAEEALEWFYIGVDYDGEGYFFNEAEDYCRDYDTSTLTLLTADKFLEETDTSKPHSRVGVYAPVSYFKDNEQVGDFCSELISEGVLPGEYGLFTPDLYRYVGVDGDNSIYFADSPDYFKKQLTREEVEEIIGDRLVKPSSSYPIAVQIRGLPREVVERVIEKLAGIADKVVELEKENVDYGLNWDYAGVDFAGRGYFWGKVSNYGDSVTVLSASEFLSDQEVETQEFSYPIAISLVGEEVSESLAREVIRKLLSIKGTSACELDPDEYSRFNNWNYVGIDEEGDGRYWDRLSSFSSKPNVAVFSLSEFVSKETKSDEKINLKDCDYPIAVCLGELDEDQVVEVVDKLRMIAKHPVEFDQVYLPSAFHWNYVGVDYDGEGYFWDEVADYGKGRDASSVTVLHASQILFDKTTGDYLTEHSHSYPIAVDIQGATNQEIFEVVKKLSPMTSDLGEFLDYEYGDFSAWEFAGITNTGRGEFWGCPSTFSDGGFIDVISFEDFLEDSAASEKTLAEQLLESAGSFQVAVELLLQAAK